MFQKADNIAKSAGLHGRLPYGRCCRCWYVPHYLLGWVYLIIAAVSKTAAAPIERVKLLIQNQVWSSYSA